MRLRTLLLCLLLLGSSTVHSAYEQSIHYVGMSCNQIQKDSIAYPANEIYLTTVVHDPMSGRVYQHKHPHNRQIYKNVKRGFKANGPKKRLWQGRQQDVVLYIMMWEYDDGGKGIDIASEYLSNAIQSALSGGTPPGQPVLEADKDPLTKLLSRGYRNLLGAEHDLVGYTRLVLRKGDWAATRPKKYGNITYHYAARHTRGGADCRSYFYFERGKHYETAKRENRQATQPRQEPARRPPSSTATDSPQAQCRPAFDRCAQQVKACQDKVRKNNQRVSDCEKHGWRQYEQCVDYYQSPARKQRYSVTQARSMCRRKYDDYVRGCPRKMRNDCPAYQRCDNDYRHCVNRSNRQQAQASRQAPPRAHQRPAPRVSPPEATTHRSVTPKKRSTTRRVTLSIDNQCPHLNTVALHYQTGERSYTTRGWFGAPLNKVSSVDINIKDDELFVHSVWGKIKDPQNRNIRKQLAVTNQSFSYDLPSSFKRQDKRFVYFYGLSLQGRSKATVVLSCQQCMKCP